MSKLYQSPLRVYLCLFALALWGLVSGLQLPISLFPNSSKPKIMVHASYGGLTADEFSRNYGHDLEVALKSATFESHNVEKVESRYQRSDVYYTVSYDWGTPGEEALREVRAVATSFGGRFSSEIRDSLWVWPNSQNSGFLAITFFSQKRSLDELYKELEPLLAPRFTRVTEAERVSIWNPNAKEISIELNPEKMAQLGLTPSDISRAIEPSLSSYSGGSVMVGSTSLSVALPRGITSIDELSRLPILTASGSVHLSDIAHIDFGVPLDKTQVFRTSGSPSLMVFARPKPGGNIKKMAEDIMAVIKETQPSFAKDVQYKVLVDPSEFIRSAVNNVLHEVFLAALLAVIVLFIFIGNVRNVITAAIEIPMSIVLAFIMMKWFGINLNLISLGGLALSAGMNVDASVVVMENIFRRFDEYKGKPNAKERLRLVVEAVDEVRFPVMASTLASLVVFLPLAMTSGLTNAILGDLALAVVFSHGFSAFVALVLVPTVRLQMMSMEKATTHSRSPIESTLNRLENLYVKNLNVFMKSSKAKVAVYGGLTIGLALLIAFVLPRLPREIVGSPDTDWVNVGVSAATNTNMGQLEEQSSEVEAKLINLLQDRVLYTFTQLNSKDYAEVMLRLKDKSQMSAIKKELEDAFPNTPMVQYYISTWNPSELPIPDPPQMSLVIRGTQAKDRVDLAKQVNNVLMESKLYSGSINTDPGVEYTEAITLKAQPERWAALAAGRSDISPYVVADLTRVATEGRRIGDIAIEGRTTNVNMLYPKHRVSSIEDLSALPIGIGGRIIPLGALAKVSLEKADPAISREDGKDLVRITGRLKDEDKSKVEEINKKSQALIEKDPNVAAKLKNASILFEDAGQELTDSLRQLGYAIGLSILLIFITMVFQFGDIVNALLVLVSIPLGFIGVLISLFVFKSTLSLNSALGVILLNGISVANSIILVDFLKRLVDQGVPPSIAALEAAKKRVRPILMTSLTTGLGMFPVAIGLGEGGRILQPLGIAVVGGLGFSMLMTLFVVPSLQVSYLEWKSQRKALRGSVVSSDASDGVEVAGSLPPASNDKKRETWA